MKFFHGPLPKEHHTSDDCANCAELDRRARTLAGRLGSLLISIGVWLGGR